MITKAYQAMKKIILLFLVTNFFGLCTQAQTATEEATKIAEEAFIYGYPIVENYRIMYYSTQDKNYEQYAPFNTFFHADDVASSKDTIFVAPNVDTPYSYATLNVKSEPVVLTIPKFEENRFIGVPFYDLYTHVIYTISPKNNGHSGGSFLIANENWKGDLPKGIKKRINSETDLIYVLIRTQLFDKKDLKRVHELQSEYKIETLSEYLGKIAKKDPPFTYLKPILPQSPYTKPDLEFFNVLNFALQFTNPHPSETTLLKRFASIGIIPGKPFETENNPNAKKMLDGIKKGQDAFLAYLPKIKSSSELFGSRAYLKNNYIARAVGAWTGIYANEADVFLGIQGYERQADGNPFSGKNKYTFTFKKDDFPPVDSFWSVTLYKLPSRLLYANDINRYAIQSTIINTFKKNSDGSVTLYIQHESPGKELESNWLPCPTGLFTMSFRCYLPKEPLRNGTWIPPAVIMKN
ncbi:DUF1254 domain-containing protein [Flavobacterium sp. M31R6]|uniref:DUF1254 domain-containing protein n=1 Tax=Flavobacterium sp. M31R6 TaxID=2739062 RepID=UPI00156A15D1|nr:DUF1254 domain-containing protein [Flavobacterium sp. M31R6]QKJ64156.1 DUF1254 domain-containing protein [Flavobacterium sp. M31R6]